MSSGAFTVRRNVEARMRDGTRLRADAYVPWGSGPFPTVLCRTPYSKGRDVHVEMAEQFAERGYLAIVQDVRGRYASDGTFRPGFYSADHCDAEDGYDTVEWAAELPWSDGKVGTFGNSYCGWTQWELAHTRPPHLVAMVPQGIAANLLDRELSGVLRLGRVLWWSVNTLAPDERRRAGDTSGPHTHEEADRLWEERDRSKWLWYLPLADIPNAVMYGMGEHWRNWLADHTTDFFGFEEKHARVAVPALSITGWYDQQIGTIKQFTGMRERGMTARAREHQYLIIGPWTHTSTDWEQRLGDVDFGPAAQQDYYEVADQWFRYWLRGERNEVDEWPPIRLFVMGANRWRDEQEWPLARTQYTEFFLHSGGDCEHCGRRRIALAAGATGRAAGRVRVRPARSGDDAVYGGRAAEAARSAAVGLAARRAGVSHGAADGAARSDRADNGAAVGGFDGEGHRLRGQGGGPAAGRVRAGAMPRDRAGALPRFADAADAAGTGPGLRVHHCGEPDEQPVPARSPAGDPRYEQRFSELRPQPQYGRQRLRRGDARRGAADGVSRRRAAVAGDLAGYSVSGGREDLPPGPFPGREGESTWRSLAPSLALPRSKLQGRGLGRACQAPAPSPLGPPAAQGSMASGGLVFGLRRNDEGRGAGGGLGRDARAGGGRRRAAAVLGWQDAQDGWWSGIRWSSGRFGVRSAGCQCIVSL